MTHRARLKVASLSFAILWTGWMIWSQSPLHPAEIVIFIACGVLAGFGWYWLYGRWYRWYFASRLFPRKRAN